MIEPWPDASTPEGAAFFANAGLIKSLLEAQGVAEAIIIAALANGERESGLDPNAKGDWIDAAGKVLPWSPHPVGTPTSFGLWQHQKLRLDIIKAKTGIDIEAAVMAGTNTVQNDVTAAMWEFRNNPRYGWTTMQGLWPWSAARAWCASFEQAGAPDALNLSGEMANRWATHLATVIDP